MALSLVSISSAFAGGNTSVPDGSIPFEINEVEWYNMDRPLTEFEETTKLVNMRFDGQKISWDNPTVASWPVAKIDSSGPDAHGNMVIGNIGFVIKIGNKWMGTASEWVAKGLQWQGEWIFHDREHHGTNNTLWQNSPFKGLKPVPGQVFYVFIMGCNWVGVSNVRERTNFVRIVYPDAQNINSEEADAINYVSELYQELLGRQVQLDLEPGAWEGFINPLAKGLLTKAEIRELMEQNVERFVRLCFKESHDRWPTLEEQNDYALMIDRDGKSRKEIKGIIASIKPSSPESSQEPKYPTGKLDSLTVDPNFQPSEDAIDPSLIDPNPNIPVRKDVLSWRITGTLHSITFGGGYMRIDDGGTTGHWPYSFFNFWRPQLPGDPGVNGCTWVVFPKNDGSGRYWATPLEWYQTVRGTQPYHDENIYEWIRTSGGLPFTPKHDEVYGFFIAHASSYCYQAIDNGVFSEQRTNITKERFIHK
jgi:hypothetical protein